MLMSIINKVHLQCQGPVAFELLPFGVIVLISANFYMTFVFLIVSFSIDQYCAGLLNCRKTLVD